MEGICFAEAVGLFDFFFLVVVALLTVMQADLVTDEQQHWATGERTPTSQHDSSRQTRLASVRCGQQQQQQPQQRQHST